MEALKHEVDLYFSKSKQYMCPQADYYEVLWEVCYESLQEPDYKQYINYPYDEPQVAFWCHLKVSKQYINYQYLIVFCSFLAPCL